MTLLNSSMRLATVDQGTPYRSAPKGAVSVHAATHGIKAALEGFLLVAVFLVASGVGFYLRARLGFAH